LEWDHRDDRQEPRHGYYFALAFQEGGWLFGGSFDYVRLEPEARAYFSVLEDDRLTFAFRVRVGTLLPGHGAQSPIVARFYSGGNDMRGFGARYLSPLALVPNSDTTSDGYYVPVGGDGLAEGSIEARYRITRPLVIATFFDTGAVTTGQLSARGSGSIFDNLQYAVGAGLRYLTPLGPIRLDFAYRLDLGPALPVQVLGGARAPSSSGCFGFGKGRTDSGGAPEGACSIQISIGEAF
jgi:translocation and assembly module TamA